MKRIMFIGLIALSLLIFLISSCLAPAPQKSYFPIPNKTSEPFYATQQLSPNVIRVIGLITDGTGSKSGFYNTVGYGEAFAKALQEIGKKYYILEIEAITYKSDNGSHTKELIVIVR